jgi:Xaa-Pro aminopeptidase
MDYHAIRRERLTRLLTEEKLDGVLVANPVNVTYLTNFSGDSSALVLTRNRAVLVSDPRYTGQIADECPGLETFIRTPAQKPFEAFAAVLEKVGVRDVGFESAALTVADFETLRQLAPALNWKGSSDRVERLRAVKDALEVGEIREAIALAERAFTVFRALLRPEDREIDLFHAMDGYIRRVGGLGGSFPPIIAVGERSALPHAPPTARAVGSADVLLVDWGATGPHGYKSDLTRVLDTRTNSSFASKLEEVYAVVLRAQQAAIAAVRPGARGDAIDTTARSVIADAGFGDYFGHGLGHGIGLQIHEAPALRPNSTYVMEPGMIVTVEPGIYLPEWGGVRIEDDVLVTPDGCEVLTNVPRDLAEMKAFV